MIYLKGCAVARAFPLYSRKSSTPATRTVSVDFVCEGADKIDVARIQVASNAIRLAARLVDTPPCCLHTDAFVEEARAVQRRLEHKGVTLTIKQGETLKNEG
jgi:probable aminopeptidase NPEPL1